MAKQNNKKHILFRYGLIVIGFLIFSALIVTKMFFTTIVYADDWNHEAEQSMSKIDTINPERGNILASNGNILACNMKVYDIRLDLRHAKIKKLDPIPWASIDSLADSLDFYYPRYGYRKSTHQDSLKKYSWHTRLKKLMEVEPEKRTRSLRIVSKGSLEDFNKIRNFPWLKNFTGGGMKLPLYKEEKNVRIRPYGSMAGRSIGRVNENAKTGEIHGYSGLEKDLDSLLYGKEGYAKRVALMSGVTNWITMAPQRGYDIRTTIDIDIQDILEEELLKVCDSVNAEWGTAIIMEVSTGAIRGISNIELLDDGTYGEARNRAVMGFEPGSVMKPISMLIAFEDGLVHSVNETVDCSPFQRTSDPHAPTIKNMKQVIEMSSNTGIARVIFRGYRNDPSKFHDRLASIGFFEPMHTGIAGEQVPRIRKLLPKDSRGNNITMTARHLDLARQAYGYNTEIPPLYTLSIYNAIANGGRYVRPHLVHSIIDENGNDSVFPISYIRDRICSEETAEKVKQCIHEVVWGEHGTARLVRSDKVKIAGKTGTAYPIPEHGGSYDHSKRRYAFAGFFPYDRPVYSCMALILTKAGTSANRTSGQVVKNVALKLYARGMLNNKSTYTATRSNSSPTVYASKQVAATLIKTYLNLPSIKQLHGNTTNIDGKVPNVVGYDINSAIKILEQSGLNVGITGEGYVCSQSITAGNPYKRGDKIILTLKP